MKKNLLAYFIFVAGSYSLLFSGSLSILHAEADKIIKFATIAPEGSTWTKVFHEINEEIQTKSKGRMKLKIYAGGVMGDETDIIRKMRVSQIHCAALTSLGLANILPETRIFDLPLFYNDSDEISFIKDELYDKFNKAFENKGYLLLGWQELGFIRFFSKKEIKSISDIRSTRMWLWEGDPLAKTLFSVLSIPAVPLSLPNVFSAMQTGLIDTLYGSPLVVIALNWFNQVKYMLELPLANATGALLIERKYYNKLSPDLQKILKESFGNHMDRLSCLIQEDNAESEKAMISNGIKLIPANDAIVEELKQASIRTCDLLTEKLFSIELLTTVIENLEKYRNSNHLLKGNESYVININDIINDVD